MSLLTASVERLSDSMGEWASFHREHYDELALNKSAAPLKPQYAAYREMDEAGRVVFVALREDGHMVGYYVGFVMPCLHYTLKTCTTDIFYVHPRVRGRFGGVRLFRAVERELKRLRVKRWFVGEKIHRPAGRLFAALGFSPIETHHSKLIGD